MWPWSEEANRVGTATRRPAAAAVRRSCDTGPSLPTIFATTCDFSTNLSKTYSTTTAQDFWSAIRVDLLMTAHVQWQIAPGRFRKCAQLRARAFAVSKMLLNINWIYALIICIAILSASIEIIKFAIEMLATNITYSTLCTSRRHNTVRVLKHLKYVHWTIPSYRVLQNLHFIHIIQK